MSLAPTPSRRSDDPDRSFEAWIENPLASENPEALLTVFNQMVDRHPDLICVYKPDGQILYVNRAFGQFYGRRRRELVQTHLPMLAPEEGRESAEENLLRIAALGPDDGPWLAEVEMIDFDGRTRWVEWRDSPIFDGDGRVGLITATGRDVTDRHLADERLVIANKRLEESNRDLSDFAYVASHDLQEPLRKISAFSDRLTVKAADELSEKNLDYLQRINGAAGRMQRLIDDLLTFSRVTTRGSGFELIDLDQILDDVKSDLEMAITESNASVEVGPLPNFEADPTQMRQLFQNLIGNSIKFRSPDRDPEVTIHGRLVRDPHDRDRDTLEIEVRDNGIGFDDKYAEKIFTVFQRLHNRTEYSGSGIGLSVCRRIAERHQGSLRASGVDGEGARFVFSLPVRESA